MSNNHYLDSRTQEPETSWNIPHLFKATALVSSAVACVLAISHLKETKKETSSKITQPDIVQAFIDNRDTFQGLPIIHI